MDLKSANTSKAPGSATAVKEGCKCDPLFNANGLGCRNDICGTPMYSVSSLCPVHSPAHKDAAVRGSN